MPGEEAPPPFGQLLKRARIRAALTQQELAERAGISLAALRDLEQGRSRFPRPGSVRALATALAIPSDQLTGLREEGQAELGPVRLHILGPLRVTRGPVTASLGRGRHRLVLARLALSPQSAVSREELIDLLWGNNVPPSAVNLVQTYVSRLRKVLDQPEMLVNVAGGYRLRLGPDHLDAADFRDVLQAARAAVQRRDAMALLDKALDLWRGDPLSDIGELQSDPRIAALHDDRVDAVIVYADLAQRLSSQESALPRLRDAAQRYPLHEPLQARFIAALAATGRQATAVETFRAVRERLADELGMDPGPELSQTYDDVLHQRWGRLLGDGQAPAPSVPFQTPAPPPDFTGRVTYLGVLQAHLVPDEQNGRHLPLCVISGPAGAGKTTVALRVAQLMRPTFPDGQLFVDLRGAGPHPLPPLDALAGFLRALGIEGRAIPTDEAESAALLRSLLAARRMLVLLDNAAGAAQVRPLLPGAGGCAVLVTSRRRLADLAGATHVDLELFSRDESLSLLTAMAGAGRVAADPDAAAKLAAACGHLPIALRVAGGRLVSRPHWTVDSLLGRLGDERGKLDELKVGDLGVEASFELSYRELAPRPARAFRTLALIPGPDFGTGAAAAMLGDDPRTVEDDLNELMDANLLNAPGDGRYSYHDLLRLFAQRLAHAADPEPQRLAALDRLLRGTWRKRKTR